MPESLAFAAPTPAFVYANVFFDAAVSVVNDHNTRITGVRKPLVLALRFHDTYDVVDEQDAILEPDRGTSLAVDPATGVCQLRVRLKTFTATCDGRTFCIEARAADSDAEPAFSTPITVVKEKLAIVQQPPDVWFKDEGGREKCMAITLVLEPAPGAVIEDRVIPLDVRLLYESGNAVLNQSILRLFPDMRPNMTRGRVTISFRIDDVSKNHQGQSFVLEVSPERQDSSSMFQDIAPTRTSVIAIRSKRNKRKLNAASHSVAAGSATRASPRSVAGTPRTNLMMMPQPHAHVGQSPMAQQPRPRKMATMAYGMMGAQQQLPPSGRSNEMQQMTWSSHVMATTGMGGMQQVATPMQSPAAATPQHHQHQQQQMVAEWKLAAFEIHPDGSVNTARPIYRCPQCRRMNDMDMMSANAAEHSPQCVFFAGGSAYRSQVEGAALQAQQQQQQQQQVQQYQQYQQSPMNSAPARSTPMMMSAQTAAMVDAQQNTVNISGISTSAGPGAFGLDVPANTSPKTLAALMQSSTQRPTISPYMNKVTAGTETPPGGSADAPSPATIASQLQPQEAGSAAGNLFASTAFRSQMEMEETATSAPLADKLTFLNKPGDEDGDPARDDLLYPGGGMPQESPSTAFVVGIGSALFNEMTSMGINLDQFDKVDAVGGAAALGDFTSMAGETTEEDQVYYILASMYTDAQSRKLGLPAFDQFQRMLGFYNEAQNDVGTQVVFHSLLDVGLSDKETVAITSNFMEELERGADAVHSLPKYQHNLILLREDALMYYWSQSLV